MRALIAARKSNKVDTATGEGIGLDTQDDKSTAFCERLGWPIAGVARDVISGRVAPIEREDLGKWLNDPAKRAQFDCVVAYQADRLSRGDDTDWSRIETWAADNGKTLVIVDSGTGIHYPSRDDSDRWQWMSQKTQAGKEWHAIRERIIRSQCAILTAGGWCGRAPFGYTITGEIYRKHLQVIEALRPIVVTIFDMAIEGVSLRKIGEWLTSKGIKTERGNVGWPEGTVKQILENEVYSGATKRGCAECGQSHHQEVPAIVDMATQKRALAALKSRSTGGNGGGRPSTNPAMLVPMCQACGLKMYRNPTGRQSPDYYQCRSRMLKGIRVGCNASIRCDIVDAAVDTILSAETEDEMTVTITYPAAALESEIEAVRREERAAFESDDFAKLQDKRALRLKLEDALKLAERERVESVSTGRTYGKAWSALDPSERRAWLKLRGLTVQLSKDTVIITSPVKVGKLSALGRMMPIG
jgi:DNA invertase Pin-like site-specific DNA recombinase